MKAQRTLYNIGITLGLALATIGLIISLKVLNIPINDEIRYKTYYIGFFILSITLIVSFIFLGRIAKRNELWRLPVGVIFLLYSLSMFHPLLLRFKFILIVILLIYIFSSRITSTWKEKGDGSI